MKLKRWFSTTSCSRTVLTEPPTSAPTSRTVSRKLKLRRRSLACMRRERLWGRLMGRVRCIVRCRKTRIPLRLKIWASPRARLPSCRRRRLS
ncbi:hypothetical protein BCR35DRAFT_304497 [Leucosporidium creatinivorum]|uniref:Uncharacterized protein n=1 Tax=Leucosporidium creatinivorum TaxID=106004 RepID=A0A1Y2FAC4_9BASI|nr:hypothetical protein BCR35DRAFT_304497 [Leucosporidium creatinivorum]